MRYESSITSLSWIPSEAVTGVSRAAFDSGFTHYDDPPPAQIDDLVVVFQAGADGLTASPTAFLSHPAPAEVLVLKLGCVGAGFGASIWACCCGWSGWLGLAGGCGCACCGGSGAGGA